jgi:hypothetical protein
VYPTDGPAIRPIDILLADAYIAPHFDEYDQPSAAERVVCAARDLFPVLPSDQALCDEHDQLVYELNLTSALVLGDSQAAAMLARLADEYRPEPEGALVFGCLLHLTGYAEASQFWWRFAAGAGFHLAAYCLYLYHAQCADFEDARFWRRESDALRTGALAPDAFAPQGPLLSDRVYHALLAQCWSGQKPQLPLDVEIAVSQLLVDGAEYGTIWLPSAQLPSVLAMA